MKKQKSIIMRRKETQKSSLVDPKDFIFEKMASFWISIGNENEEAFKKTSIYLPWDIVSCTIFLIVARQFW